MLSERDTQSFVVARPKLLGLAYRMLGSLAEAEDAVQDTYLKWAAIDRNSIQSPESWLRKTCTRRCLDLLRAAHNSRVNYVGAWLPEPVHQASHADLEADLDLENSLQTAFLLVLERLTPKERAAFLLREVFDETYKSISEALEIQESACRKLVSRAKVNIEKARTLNKTPINRQDELLAAFKLAVTTGSMGQLVPLLAEDIKITTDSGGKVPATLEDVIGVEEVTQFLGERLHEYWKNYVWDVAELNGSRGVVLTQGGVIEAAVSFAYDENQRIAKIYIFRNPDKLRNLSAVTIN